MSVPHFVATDFAAAGAALMPPGLVWQAEAGGPQAQVLLGLGGTLERQSDAAAALVYDAFPPSTQQLLTDWEASLGLPDPCAGESPSLQQRRDQVVARLTNGGGASAAYYIAYAGALGFTITIRRYTPFRVGQVTVGHQLGGDAWAYTFAVVAPQTTTRPFRVGQSAVGEPLNSWGNAVLECELTSVLPAHANVLFQYQ